ncbi:Pyruvate synthase subunit PorD [compost metagenome]
MVEPNINTFNRGYHEVKFKTYKAPDEVEGNAFIRSKTVYGYETQEIGGVLVAQANSILKDLSGSRQGWLPEFHEDQCISCAACDNVCPDLCFVWEEAPDKRGLPLMFLRGIDYKYCKGCLKCVDACPTQALTDLREEVGYVEAHTVSQNFVMLQEG